MMKHHLQKGFLLISALIFMTVIVGLLTGIAAYLALTASHSMVFQVNSIKSRYIAETGLEKALSYLQAGTIICSSINSDPEFTNVSLGDGAYTVTTTSYNPSAPSTLSDDMLADSTVIPISSLTGYAPYGRVTIENEAIDYTGTSASEYTCGIEPCLTGAARGVGGTAAAVHASGKYVLENQCRITSTGSVPNAASPTAQSAVTNSFFSGKSAVMIAGYASAGEGIFGSDKNSWTRLGPYAGIPDLGMRDVVILALDDAWMVGIKNTSGDPTIIHWDGYEFTWVATGLPLQHLLGVACSASNDCWAVGYGTALYHYSAGIWSQGPIDLSVPLVNYNSVYCTSSNNCYAVGAPSGGESTIIQWNGTTWTRVSLTGLPNKYLMSVRCLNANDCWAIGYDRTFLHQHLHNQQSSQHFYH